MANEMNRVGVEEAFQEAVASHGQGRLEQAEQLYRAILRGDQKHLGALHNLGILCFQQGDYDGAVAFTRALVQQCPDMPTAYNTLAVALKQLGRLAEAEKVCREALSLAPDYAEAHNTLADTLTGLRRFAEAEACCREALRLAPEYVQAHNNLGNVFLSLGRPDEAETSYREALRLKPKNRVAFHNLGNALVHQGKLKEASETFGQAAALDPNNAEALTNWFAIKRRICDWSEYPSDEVRYRDGLSGAASANAVFRLLGTWAMAEEQLVCAQRVAAKFAVPKAAMLSNNPTPTQRDKIRLGYLSSDFQALPTAFLSVGVFEHHDRDRFEVIAYSAYADDGSTTRRRVISAVDRFADISEFSDLKAAQRIRDDDIDILIDLNGFKPVSRPKILAYRPAPVQVNYLGYPGTMGADFIDYILVDRFIAPPDQQPFFGEQFVYLPDCYQCNDDKRQIAERIPTRAECGLPERGFVFCCFNDTWKLTPTFFDIWMRLLSAVPGSVLWLLEAEPGVQNNLAREALGRGIPAGRLVFAPRWPLHEHLARHHLADLFLDALPYNAHTTASDALWAGLPVLTCAGYTFAGRVAGSLLRAIGLDELITESLQDYEALALRLARDADLLARLRARLAANRHSFPLFDTRRSTRNLEAAFARMCEINRTGQPPTGFSVRLSQ